MNTLFNQTTRLTKTHIAADKFDTGDHWQKGDAFPLYEIAKSSEQKASMEKALQSANKIAEICGNEQNALFGREPDWSAVKEENNEPQNKLAGETETALLDYWNAHQQIKKLKKANRLAGKQERCFIRAFTPTAFAGNRTISGFRDAMELLRFQVLSADKGGVFTDEDTQEKYGLFRKQTADGKNYTELTFVENGLTYVRKIEGSDFAMLADETLPILKSYMPADSTTTDEIGYNLGGALMYFEIEREVLISQSIISNQKGINLGLTNMARLIYQAAYRDFFFFDTDQEIDANGKPVPIKTGGKTANFLKGLETINSQTKEIISTAKPSMQVIEPANPENILKAIDKFIVLIYEEASQTHLARSDSAAASGISKRESRFSFEKRLFELKQTMDAAGRWMLKVLTLFAADYLNRSNDYLSLQFDFNCRIDAGAPDPEEIKQASQDVKDGNLSFETYLSKYLRFDDADSETARLTTSESYHIAMWKRRLEIAQLAADLGLPSSEIVMILYPDDEAKQQQIVGLIKAVPVALPALPVPLNKI